MFAYIILYPDLRLIKIVPAVLNVNCPDCVKKRNNRSTHFWSLFKHWAQMGVKQIRRPRPTAGAVRRSSHGVRLSLALCFCVVFGRVAHESLPIGWQQGGGALKLETIVTWHVDMNPRGFERMVWDPKKSVNSSAQVGSGSMCSGWWLNHPRWEIWFMLDHHSICKYMAKEKPNHQPIILAI